jgi:hypothetical protein
MFYDIALRVITRLGFQTDQRRECAGAPGTRKENHFSIKCIKQSTSLHRKLNDIFCCHFFHLAQRVHYGVEKITKTTTIRTVTAVHLLSIKINFLFILIYIQFLCCCYIFFLFLPIFQSLFPATCISCALLTMALSFSTTDRRKKTDSTTQINLIFIDMLGKTTCWGDCGRACGTFLQRLCEKHSQNKDQQRHRHRQPHTCFGFKCFYF